MVGTAPASTVAEEPRAHVAACARAAAAWTMCLCALAQAAGAESPRPLPQQLERYLADVVRPSAGERLRLMRGEPLARLLESDASREVAVFGAVWVNASRAAYRISLEHIAQHERGRAFHVTRRLGTPPSLDDFADLRLPDGDLRDLRECRVGDCRLKLGQASIEAFRSRVDFASPAAKDQAEAVFRERLLDYVTRYRANGNDGMIEYRDAARPLRAADEFAAIVDPMPPLSDAIPEVRRYLLGFPRVALPGVAEFLYWQEVRFGLKPTIRVSHLVILEGASDTIVASKMIYASHYFRAALELRVLVPDPARGNGYWLVTVTRSRVDGLGGLLGPIIRARVRSEARNAARAMLASSKARLERVEAMQATPR